jgi:hypothetical protein
MLNPPNLGPGTPRISDDLSRLSQAYTARRTAQQPQPQPHQETDREKLIRLYGKDAVERAELRYPWASQGKELMETMAEELRAAADRQQGHSYSIHVK